MTHKKARTRGRAPSPSRLPLLLMGAALLLAVAAAGLWFAGGNSAQGGTPKLAVNRERIDFGAVPFDVPVRAEFKIENSGDGMLSLDASTPVKVLEGC